MSRMRGRTAARRSCHIHGDNGCEIRGEAGAMERAQEKRQTAREVSGELAPADDEIGSCDLCGQIMYRTRDDCWHPWNVARACPPEPAGAGPDYGAWIQAGNRSLRPGREHFVPGFTCPVCGRTSHNPNDVREGYCGACHDWTRRTA